MEPHPVTVSSVGACVAPISWLPRWLRDAPSTQSLTVTPTSPFDPAKPPGSRGETMRPTRIDLGRSPRASEPSLPPRAGRLGVPPGCHEDDDRSRGGDGNGLLGKPKLN